MWTIHIQEPRTAGFIFGLLFCSQIAFAQKADVSKKPVIFYAMGDVPYSEDEAAALPQQIQDIPDDARFVMHVGDIKRGFVPCLSGVYQSVADRLKKSRQPLFIIPGDNEWNDCLIPSAAWDLWNEYFMRFEQNWQHQIPVFRQLEREENFSFVLDDVLFLGLNLVGGRVHDPEEWNVRHAQNFDWTKRNIERCGDQLRAVVIFGHAHPKTVHDDFFESLDRLALSTGKQFLYLHGDGHSWIQDRPFRAKNILRIQVDQGGHAPPLKVTVGTNLREPFIFDRRLPVEADNKTSN